MARILIIDDDPVFGAILIEALKGDGHEATQVLSGKAGVTYASADLPNLVILDMTMPEMGGLEVCQKLKASEKTSQLPILVLTGNSKEGQEVSCLNTGADDYLTKPVNTEILIARCGALLRRLPNDASRPPLSVGKLVLDYDLKLATLGKRQFPNLTPKEFGLLYEIASHSPKPCDQTSLYQKVWGADPPSPKSLKTVEVHIRRIRLKLGWRENQWLSHVPGRGYCLKTPVSA